MFYILDTHGEPALCEDLAAWSAWFAATNRHVARDSLSYFGRELVVSTVFLGLDHRSVLNEQRPPVLWETMLFLECEPYIECSVRHTHETVALNDSDKKRYVSRAEAEREHRKLVTYLQAFAESRRLFGDPHTPHERMTVRV